MGFQEGDESTMKKASFTRKRVFQKGDKVEVCSKEYGFIGSYYAAIVLEKLGDKYKVVYKNLVEEDDESKPLVEIVTADEVRPRPSPPPREKVDLEFDVLDRVDVFDNKGWWVGTITEKRGEDEYFVYFETTADHIAYPKRKLRFHRDWIDGQWLDYNQKKRVVRVDGKLVDCKKRVRAQVDERVVDCYKRVRIDGNLVDCKDKLRVSIVPV